MADTTPPEGTGNDVRRDDEPRIAETETSPTGSVPLAPETPAPDLPVPELPLPDLPLPDLPVPGSPTDGAQPGRSDSPRVAIVAEPASTDTRAERRTFAQLHRDFWRVVGRSPLIFLLIPAVAWFLVDLLMESLVSRTGGTEMEQLRLWFRLNKVANVLVGIPVSVLFLAAVRVIARGHRPTWNSIIGSSDGLFGRLFATYYAAAWRIGLGTLLLIVPGIYLSLRYALAPAVAVFEEVKGKEALERSGEYVKGQYWRLLGLACGAMLLYLPLTVLGSMLLPEPTSPLMEALAGIPARVLTLLGLIALTLLYADRRLDRQLAEPVGRSTSRPGDSKAPISAGQADDRRDAPTWTDGTRGREASVPSGRRGVVIVATLSVASLLVTLFVLGMPVQPDAVALGDAAYEAGDVATALMHYQEAAAVDPDNAWVQYSLGWCWSTLDEVEAAETCFGRAVEIEPDNPFYLLDHGSALLALGRLEAAERRVGQALAQGHPNEELLSSMQQRLKLMKSLE